MAQTKETQVISQIIGQKEHKTTGTCLGGQLGVFSYPLPCTRSVIFLLNVPLKNQGNGYLVFFLFGCTMFILNDGQNFSFLFLQSLLIFLGANIIKVLYLSHIRNCS